jgi:hypothetical protein
MESIKVVEAVVVVVVVVQRFQSWESYIVTLFWLAMLRETFLC